MRIAARSSEPILNSINFSLSYSLSCPFSFSLPPIRSLDASLIVPVYHKPGTMYIHHTYQLIPALQSHHVRARMYLLESDFPSSCLEQGLHRVIESSTIIFPPAISMIFPPHVSIHIICRRHLPTTPLPPTDRPPTYILLLREHVRMFRRRKRGGMGGGGFWREAMQEESKLTPFAYEAPI